VKTLTGLVVGKLMVRQAPGLRERLTTPWTIREWVPEEGEAAFHERVADCDALIGGHVGGTPLPAPHLKLLQIPFTGHDWLDPDLLPAGCVVCNTYEHEIPIAEYVLLCMLEWQIGLRRLDREFRAGNWRHSFMFPDAPFHGELYGKTVGLVGYGHIARETAQRAASFGMRVVAVSRRPREAPAPLAWYDTLDGLDRLLAESDYVVLSCPLTVETRGLFDAARLARMKPGAVLVNVARGGVVDEDALYAALMDGPLGGAVLDVWYRYPGAEDPSPRPSRWPFHGLPNVIMTPHCSTWTAEHLARRWDFVAANLDRLARGEALLNVVESPGA